MPEKSNTVRFVNLKKQLHTSFIIYTNFEANKQKFKKCDRNNVKSYTNV